MQKLVFTNGGGNTIDLTSGNFGITNWEGLSGVGLNIQTQQVPFQDGGVFLDALMEQREISVTVAIQDNNDLSARYERKRELISALNPKLGEGVLVYTNDYLSRQIKAVPQLPIFENKNSNDSGTLKASVTFSCPSPYWEDLEEIVVTLSNGVKVDVGNNGDIPVQVKIKLTKGAKNPMIINQQSQKALAINGVADNDIYINTNSGQKSVTGREMNFIWNAGGTFRSYAKTADKIVYVGTQIVVENLYTGQIEPVAITLNVTLYGIVYANEMFVAVGGSGTIMTSSDGRNWDITNIGSQTFNNVIYAKGMFVVIGNSSLYTSTDGKEWTLRTTPSSQYKRGIAYSQQLDLFVVVAYAGKIITSSDGITWTSQTTPTNKALYSVIYANGLFVAVGEYEEIITSPDGINWTERNTSPSNYSINCVAYANGLFVTVGSGIYVSQDGITWTRIGNSPVGGTLEYVDYINGAFTATGVYGSVITSSNGQDWTVKIGGVQMNGFSCIAYSDELKMFVAGGLTNPTLVTSTDGKIWVDRIDWEHYIYYPMNDIVYAKEKFVGAGSRGRTVISSDGINWIEQRIDGSSESDYYCGISYFEDLEQFMIVGYNAESGSLILISSDGLNWTSIASGTSVRLNSSAYSDSLGIYVIVGDSGTILTSSNGTTWTSRISGTSGYLRKVIFANNQFIVVGEETGGIILTSSDGINWVKQNTGGQLKGLNNIIYVKGMFIAVGSNTTAFSYDSINWVNIPNCVNANFVGIAYSEDLDLFIVVGSTSIANSDIQSTVNLISLLSPQSDMTFNLNVGENNVLYSDENNKTATLSFRQKYIGV